MKHIFIGIPSKDGRITVATASCLMSEGDPSLVIEVFFSQLGGITFARDEIAKHFLASGAERLVFIDEDITWGAGDLTRLLSHDVDLVGGCYRLKQEKEAYPIRWLGGVEPANPGNDLIEVDGLPTGFLSIRRTVFEKMYAAHPERKYKNAGNEYHGYFAMPYGWGEDLQFCRDWRALGGKVWLDPTLNLTHHAGPHSYHGNIGDWLRSRAALKDAA